MTWIFGRRGAEGKLLTRPLLEESVKIAWSWDALPEIARSARGKPYFPAAPERWFSLSHSGGLALCALSDDGPVGVDIERVRPRRPGLFAYALTEEERLLCGGDWAEFYRLWTLKESWCKREDVPIYPPRDRPGCPPCPHGSWAGEDWAAAVCCGGSAPEEICWL